MLRLALHKPASAALHVPIGRQAVHALGAYRELLKAQRSLFKGDDTARIAAREETRSHFMANANVSPEDAAALVADALDTAGFLRENVAQTVLNDRGNYGKPS